MPVYEFDLRVLVGEKEIAEAVSGCKLTHPRMNSRWMEEWAPGLATFASLNDDELYPVSIFGSEFTRQQQLWTRNIHVIITLCISLFYIYAGITSLYFVLKGTCV